MTGPRKILVAGYYGAKNAGDEAILAGLLASFREAGFTGKFAVLSHDPADTQSLHGVEAVAWNDIEAVIDAAEQTDLIVVGGGGLFHDYWGVDPTSVLTSRQGGIAQYATPVYLAAMLGKPCALLGVGVGPLQSEEGRELTRTIFDLADVAFVRDQGSFDLLKTIGASIEHISVASDLAFAAPRIALPPSAASFLSSLPRPILGVALRHWTFGAEGDSWEAEVAEAIDRWQETTGGTPLFVPMQTGLSEIEDDVAVARRMIGRLSRPELAALVPEGLNPLERFWAVGACDLVLGMRMHAIVAAIRSGIPCVGLAYDPKVDSLLAGVGRPGDQHLLLGTDQLALREALEAAQNTGDTGEVSPIETPASPSLREMASKALCGIDPERESRRQRSPTMALAQVLLRYANNDEHLRQKEVALRAAIDSSISQTEDAREVQARLKDELSRSRVEAQELQARVADIASQLDALRSTLGVRLLARYWELARRLAPPGSRRRQWFWMGRSALRRIAPGVESLSRIPQFVSPEAGNLQRDIRGYLSTFSPMMNPFVVVSGTAFKVSGGQRATHLSLELARRGYPVVFAYYRWSDSDTGDPTPVSIFQVPLDVLESNPRPFLSAFPSSTTLIMEFPHPGMFEALALARGSDWTLVYDVVDNWREFHRLGQAAWYDPDFEAHLANSSDRVLAVSPGLADLLRSFGREDVSIVPNGAREGIERIRAPVVLPRGVVTLGYFGYMTSAWFDWELIAEVARLETAWKLYLVGYCDRAPQSLPPNVICVGPVPQEMLSSYAANWDVGIVPFKPSRLSLDADPIKTYEYLAMGLAVVVTGANPPEGAGRLVRKAEGISSFVHEVHEAARDDGKQEARRAYARERSWPSRVELLLRALRVTLGPDEPDAAQRRELL